MKKLLLILLCLPMIGFGQNVNIPDANFKAYLVGNTAINTNGDTEIQFSEATPFAGSINCSDLGIFDLTGIEAFTDLTFLECDNNQLTSLDVSGTTALTSLVCQFNQITSLDVSANTALSELICNNNQLTSLDVSGTTALTSLGCEFNQLTSLDVSQNTALTELSCNHNQITSLDVSTNLALTGLICAYNPLTSLDFSTNTALTILWCEGNQLTSLDVRNGNNIIISYIFATNNPNLSCINVDDFQYSLMNWTGSGFSLDPQHYFSNNCPPSAIEEHTTNKNILKIIGILGRETKATNNEVLFYIYDDGTVEKRIVIE